MEWKEVRLGDVCDLIAGFAFKAKDFGEFPTKVIKIGDIKPPFVDYVGQVGVDISNYDINRLSKYTVKYGDYVLAMTGATIGKVGKYISENFSYINQRVLKFSPKQNVDADYINYIICSNKFAKYVVNYVDSESAQPNISAPTISKFAFQIPKDKGNQRRIASVLSSLDRKIELNNKINVDLEEMAQAIFKNWFVDFEPFKDGDFVDSELGMIPEGWKVVTLDEIFSLKYGKNLSTSMILEKGDYPVYGANGIIGYYNEYNCDTHSVLVTSRGNGSGDVSRTHHPKTFITNNSFVVEPLEQYKYIKLPFINGLFNIIDFKLYCSGSAQPQLTNKAMRNICIISPPMGIVIKYCEMLETLFSHIECVIAENSRLSLLRDTLLPRLMSGEIEVPE